MTDLRLQPSPSLPFSSPSSKLQSQFINQIGQLGIQPHTLNKQDLQELYKLLNHHLYYPKSELAEIHRNSNKLGEIDLKIEEERDVRQTMIRSQKKICKCCGFFVQQSELEVCQHQFLDVINLGGTTHVFFQTFINLSILLGIMFAVYSIFSFITNLTSACLDNCTNISTSLDYLSISLSAKFLSDPENIETASTNYMISSWLAVPMLIIWLLYLIRMSKGIKKIQNQEKMYTSVADFSVVIEKMPTELSKQSVQAMLDDYFLKISLPGFDLKQLKIQKYNEAQPFYFNIEEFNDQNLIKLYQRIKEIKEEIVQWIRELAKQGQFFSTTKEHRNAALQELQNTKYSIHLKNQEIVNKIKSKLKQKNKQAKTFVFITFETIEQRDFFLAYNNNSILSKIKNILPCFNKEQRFSVMKDGIQFRNLVIQSAPQPQDINWGNIGFGDCQSIWRKFITFTATLILLGISFVIVYSLSTVQKDNQKRRFVSILISLVISIINIIIIKVVQFMTVVQKIYTMNNFQISSAVKCILAQLLNTIFIPIMVNIYIKDNLYEKSGLSQDIFILAIANSFIPPIIVFFDPYYIFTYIRYHYYNRPFNKIVLSQFELNALAQKPQFQIGLQYIYLISNFLFICFFVSLQPIIPLFGLLGLLMMYWSQKRALFNRCQRPVPGIDTIGTVMYQMIYFGGIVYVLGSLTWSIFLKDQNFKNSLIPNLVSGGISVLIFIFPYESLIDYKQNINYKKQYKQRRIYFPAQYDRLNPATNQEGVRQYKEFLDGIKKEIGNGMNQTRQKDISDRLIRLTQPNIYKNHRNGNDFFGNDQVKNALMQIMQNQSRNVLDPKILMSHLGLIREGNANYQNNDKFYSDKNIPQEKIGSLQKAEIDKDENHAFQQQNYFLQQQRPNDDFHNKYKSTLFLGDLGIGEEKMNNTQRFHKSK